MAVTAATTEYPAHLIRERRLLDGRAITIRPIRADDAGRVRALLDASSENSRYKRFHKWVHAPSNSLIHFLTDVDYDRHMALVCSFAHENGEELVGEARYVANPDGKSCDFGILIEDSWRKSGIAGLLMEALIRAARDRGLLLMEGLVLANNTAMLRFAHPLGFEIQPTADDRTTVRIVMKLQSGAGATATGQLQDARKSSVGDDAFALADSSRRGWQRAESSGVRRSRLASLSQTTRRRASRRCGSPGRG